MRTATKNKTKTDTDIYSIITDRIISQLEAGVKPWVKPWNKISVDDTESSYGLPLKHDGKPYTGINVISLWMSGLEHSNSIWMTYNQAKQLGGQVKKGEKGSPVFYAANCYEKKENENGEIEKQIIDEKMYLKLYWVFNVSQIEGLPEKYYVVNEKPKPQINMDAIAKKAIVKHGGGRAFYNIAGDYIQMPKPEQFINHDAYFSTLAHELTHWTGHETRLNRTFGQKFGDYDYAFEELVAELGAAFICAKNGKSTYEREDHASYINEWLSVLRENKRAIFKAASLAQKAVEFILSDHKPSSDC